MESASAYLVTLGRRVAAAYRIHTDLAAILVTGSAAEGVSDPYSDLDLIVYHDALPTDARLQSVHGAIGAMNVRPLGPPSAEERGEAYVVDGVECQVGHVTVARWERDMAGVQGGQEIASPLQKAISGLLVGIPLHGEARIAQWRSRAADYPEALARAMVEHYRRFFPLWYIGEYIAPRDARLWTQQVLVESAFNILGVLAGLKRRYYTPFQFKRMRAFIATLAIAPDDLASRLESLLAADQGTAIAALEAVVGETVALVRREIPAVDTASAAPRLGQRHQPWHEGS